MPASRRMGVHAPDIKEEFKEFKALEGSRFGLCTRKPAIFAVLVRPDRKPWRSRRLPGTKQRLAALSALRASGGRALYHGSARIQAYWHCLTKVISSFG